MTTIQSFVAKNAKVGQRQTLKAHEVVWVTVGHGSVTSLSDYNVGIGGKVEVLGYHGDLIIDLTLNDEDPKAQKGPCTLKLNTLVDKKATYQVKGHELRVSAVLDGNKQEVDISPCNHGQQTQCVLSGKIHITVHLEPEK